MQPGFAVAISCAPVALTESIFLLKKSRRHVGVDDVINSGAAATEIGKRHFAQLQAGNGIEQLARRGAYLLAMRQMAGVLIGHGDGRARNSGLSVDGCQELR